MKTEKKVCFKCKKDIYKNDWYFEFVEYKNEEMVHFDYAHKNCWDEIKSNLNLKEKYNKLLFQMQDYLDENGIIKKPEEEIVIK